jgi:hypothetical protein
MLKDDQICHICQLLKNLTDESEWILIKYLEMLHKDKYLWDAQVIRLPTYSLCRVREIPHNYYVVREFKGYNSFTTVWRKFVNNDLWISTFGMLK